MNPTEWVASLSTVDGLRLQQGASAHDIDECESTLRSRLPSALRNLYLASDGVWDEPGQWFVIWPLMEVVERNRVASEAESHRRRDWVAFGDDGAGNPFCVDRQGNDAVYYWSPIDQAATRLAADPAAFWKAWVADSLPAQ